MSESSENGDSFKPEPVEPPETGESSKAEQTETEPELDEVEPTESEEEAAQLEDSAEEIPELDEVQATEGDEQSTELEEKSDDEEPVLDEVDAEETEADITTAEEYQEVDYPGSSKQGVELNRDLTSREQMGQAIEGRGEAMAEGAKGEVRDADRLAAQYGGEPGDWNKMRSESSDKHGATTNEGNNFETHWYENTQTGQIEEMKTKIQGH
jgi:hypothetical protein